MKTIKQIIYDACERLDLQEEEFSCFALNEYLHKYPEKYWCLYKTYRYFAWKYVNDFNHCDNSFFEVGDSQKEVIKNANIRITMLLLFLESGYWKRKHLKKGENDD